jgi:hypothetical protein
MKTLTSLLILCLIIPSIYAQQSREIHEPYFGVDFTVPEGWNYQRTEIGYILGHNTIPGIIIVMGNDYKTIQEVEAAAMQGIQDANGTYLMPSDQIVPFGKNGRAGNFNGYLEGQQVSAYLISLVSTSDGKGVTMMAAASPNLFDEDHVYALEALGKSVRFIKKETPPVVEEWKKSLKVPGGARFTYMHTHGSTSYDGNYSGYSSTILIDLCPEGYFNYSSDHDMSVNTDGGYAYSASDGKGNGTWDLETDGTNAVLVLKYNDGKISEYTLTYENQKCYLNGERYFLTFSDAGENGPRCY